MNMYLRSNGAVLAGLVLALHCQVHQRQVAQALAKQGRVARRLALAAREPEAGAPGADRGTQVAGALAGHTGDDGHAAGVARVAGPRRRRLAAAAGRGAGLGVAALVFLDPGLAHFSWCWCCCFLLVVLWAGE